MTSLRWIIAEPAPSEAAEQLPDVPGIVRSVLWNRGIRTTADVDQLLHPSYEGLSDPFRYRQMHLAVERLLQAIQRQERITVYGDYDADGVTSTVVLVESLRMFGANVDWYVPERLTEGYGLHMAAIDRLAERGTQLLLTVDCGTSNWNEITHAKSLNIDTLVLDHHHEPEQLPPAVALINPVFDAETYPFRFNASAGVAFTLVRALIAATRNGETLSLTLTPGWEKWLLDLVAISTVADMMPLVGENRVLVSFGLRVLRKTKRPGLRALFSVMGNDIEQADEFTIGFLLAPRLNAAGRLHHASLAVELLMASDAVEARALAEQLHNINQDRQRLTEVAMTEALEQVDSERDRSAAAAFAPHWSPGIVGLVAGRLADRLWRPVVVMAENDGEIVGSGRSIPGVDIMQVMDDGRHHFARYGGHPGACGFTLASVDGREAFVTWFQERMKTAWEPETTLKEIAVDARATLEDISADALDMLDRLGPYGIEHRRPLVVIENVQVTDASTVGAEGKHIRVRLLDQGIRRSAIGFRLCHLLDVCTPGARIDVVVEPSWNTWQGRREPQLKIIDLRLHA